MSINLDGWQDYRGDHAGVLLFVETSKQSVNPVRDQLNENKKGSLCEPNYETSTFGLVSCQSAKSINSIVKNKHRYILFGTRYDGFVKEQKGNYLITGYMRIDKVKDVRSKHIHDYIRNPKSKSEPECMTLNKSLACYSEDMKFYHLEDCFVLSQEAMKAWGYKGRVTKQMKLLLEDQKLDDVLNHFATKEDANSDYIDTVKEYLESLEEEDEEEEAETEEW